nr:alpha/beta hydrolase [Bartonella apihabitans]
MQKNNDDRADIVRLDNFRYRIDRAANPSGEVIILLHGSGGDETTLFSFARPIWPQATLVGIRGRIVQNGETRWFKKITPTKFDQKDAVDEAEAFVKFLTDLGEDDQYDLSRATFVGYSNGANLLAVIMMRHPELVRRAVLMRSMPVLDSYPHKNLSNTNVLIISGKKDSLYSPFQPALSAMLTKNGAKVDSEIVNSDHMIGEKDREMIVKWLGNQNSSRILANTKTGKTAH